MMVETHGDENCLKLVRSPKSITITSRTVIQNNYNKVVDTVCDCIIFNVVYSIKLYTHEISLPFRWLINKCVHTFFGL